MSRAGRVIDESAKTRVTCSKSKWKETRTGPVVNRIGIRLSRIVGFLERTQPNGTALRTVTRERVTTVDTTGTGHGPRHPGRAPAASPDRCTSRGSRLHDCTTGNRKRNAWNGTRRSSVPIDDRPPATTPIFDPDPGGYTPRRAHEAAKRSPQTHMVCPGTMRSMVILPRGPSTAICISPPFRCPCVIMPMDAGRWILCGLYC